MFITRRYQIFLVNIERFRSELLRVLQEKQNSGPQDLNVPLKSQNIMTQEEIKLILAEDDELARLAYAKAFSEGDRQSTGIFDPLSIVRNIEEKTKKGEAIKLQLLGQSAGTFLSVFMASITDRAVLKQVYLRYVSRDDFGNVVLDAVVKKFRGFIDSRCSVLSDAEARDATTFLMTLVLASIGDEAEGTAIQERNDGRRYEEKCREILESAGFTVRLTPPTGDFGADLIAERDDVSFALQCKDNTNPVGNKAVQEAISGRKYYKTDYAAVVCDAGFTKAAKEMAARDDVLLLGTASLPSLAQLAQALE